MKKFILIVCGIVLALLIWNIAYYRLGIYVDLRQAGYLFYEGGGQDNSDGTGRRLCSL